MAYPKDINKLKKKLDLYNGIVKSNAKNTFALKKRMEVRFLLGEKEGALEDLTKLILLDPQNQNLKNHPFNPHRPDAEPIDPKYAELFINLGAMKIKSKNYADGLEAYEKAILIAEGKDDLLATAYSDASLCAVKTESWEKCYRYTSQALGYNRVQKHKNLKKNLEYLQALSFVAETNQKDEAFEPNTKRYQRLEKSVNVMLVFLEDDSIKDEDLAHNVGFIAIAYSRMGKPQLALEAINKTLSMIEMAEAYMFRAILLLKEGGNEEQASQDLRDAFRLKPDLLQSILPDLNLEEALSDEQKDKLIQSNIPMQPSMKVLDDDLDLGGGR
ncbi:MAG: hypothetical protein GY810_25840 [Aureispira sp.]|nr:hypothetical protein [Aureispira sp.]